MSGSSQIERGCDCGNVTLFEIVGSISHAHMGLLQPAQSCDEPVCAFVSIDVHASDLCDQSFRLRPSLEYRRAYFCFANKPRRLNYATQSHRRANLIRNSTASTFGSQDLKRNRA